MKWAEKPEVLSYIVDCYQGVDGKKRQFIWEADNGDIVIGNARAFTDHVSTKFNLGKTATSWVEVHHVLRALGEIAQIHRPRTTIRGGKFRNQEPEVRILRRKERLT